MRLLILGGTIFLGRALVDAALERGHEITLFHRGKHGPELYPEVEHIIGDRDIDLHLLDGRSWEAAIDTCGYFPRQVAASARQLATSVRHYTFISSISVYAGFDAIGIDETYPVGALDDPTVEEITGETYGPLKAMCEQAAEGWMRGRTLNIRPGLIVGPHDPSDRFTYWPLRVSRGGEVLAPDRPEVAVQLIDVRDLAEWTIRMVEVYRTGVYNATGLAEPLTMGEMLETCKRVTQSSATFSWASEEVLAEAEVSPWSEMPLWVPASMGAGFSAIDCSRAMMDGLTFRPLEETTAATYEWACGWPEDRTLRAGLDPEKEARALALLKERQGVSA